MPNPHKPLGVLKPLGGGDPVALTKQEILVGRRRTCDIRLDFENISGKHCQLRYVQGVWHVRDLGSTNGTTVNGQRVSQDHSIMPDDELGFASHSFSIDYDPAVAPGALIDANMFLDLDDQPAESRRPRSLLELAGLETSDNSRYRPVPTSPRPPDDDEETEFEAVDFVDAVPEEFNLSEEIAAPTDEDFFDMIRDDVEEADVENRKKSR